MNADFAVMSKADASTAEEIATTEVENDGRAIAAFCDSCENLETCQETSPQSEEWKDAAQAASVARFKAELAAQRILTR